MNFSELQATPSDNFGAAVLHAPLLRRCFQWGGLNLVRHLLTSYRLPVYSSLYGSQLPAVTCTLYVRVHVAQVPNALEGLRGKSISPFTFTQPNQSNAELLDHLPWSEAGQRTSRMSSKCLLRSGCRGLMTKK